MSLNENDISEREQEILRLLATGASNKEIARHLYISPNTVKTHLRNIFAKINVNSRTEAVLFAINEGLVPSRDSRNEDLLASAQWDGQQFSDPKLIPGWFNINRTALTIAFIFLLILSILGVQIWNSIRNQNASVLSLQEEQPERWKVLSPMPTGRYGMAAVVDRETILVIGGYTEQGPTGTVERYDPVMDIWSKSSAKPTPVYEIQAAANAGKIYIPGGRLNSADTSDMLEIYDPRQDAWSSGAALPEPRSAYGLVSFEGLIYLFGGFDGKAYSAKVFIYDPLTDQWKEGLSMPSPRGYLSAVVVSGKILIMGGYDGKKAFSDTLVYQTSELDLDQQQWSELRSMPEGRYSMAATSIADLVLLVGGTDGKGNSLNSQEYFPLTDEWITFQQLSPRSWIDLAVVPMGVHVYIIGGRVDGAPTDQAFSYRAIYTLAIPVVR